MALRSVSMVVALGCALTLPAMVTHAGDGSTSAPDQAAVTDQTRERRPPPEQARERTADDEQVRERRPDDGEARERRPDDAQVRDRPRPAPRPAARPRPTRRGSVVFIGGYFYDPFFGPYPWWPRPAHPYWYALRYDDRASLRIDCRERQAAVYVDGFYAGIVDDFDGLFQRLPLPPGGHRIALYLDGFETAEFSLYLRPGSTFTLRHAMARLAPGSVSRRPEVIAPVPAPPEGTYTPPRTAPPIVAPTPASAGAEVPFGVLELRVQPVTAVVMVDGERWMSAEDGWYELQLPAGEHRLDVTAPGHRPFMVTVDVPEEATTPLNVSLPRERP